MPGEIHCEVVTIECESADEALAELLTNAPAGYVVAVHEATCAAIEDGACDCTPLELVTGATA